MIWVNRFESKRTNERINERTNAPARARPIHELMNYVDLHRRGCQRSGRLVDPIRRGERHPQVLVLAPEGTDAEAGQVEGAA